jgi:hypothetical protein
LLALSWPSYPTFTQNCIYSNGFSPQGIAHAQAREAGMLQREHSVVQGLRRAEQQRGQALQAQRDRYHANQLEAGAAAASRTRERRDWR